MKHPIVLVILSLLAFTVPVPQADADVVMRKRVLRHFPDLAWCPFVNELELSFVAGGPEAIITLTARGVAEEPIQIDEIAVIDREKLVSLFRNVSQDCMNGDLAFYAGDPEDTDWTEQPNSWSLTNARLGETLELGIAPGETESKASVRVTGLIPGHEYFITGRSDRGDFEVQVDCPPPPAFFLANGRFRIEVRWGASLQLPGVKAHSEKVAGLWFQDASQIDMVVSATDHCGSAGNGTFWLMFAGTTAQKLRITVEDLVTGKEKIYSNGSQTRLKTVVDKATFRCRN